MKHKALNQLLCAALVNGQFREALLHDPARALSSGYLGHSFALTSEERNLVVDIQAQQLEDFAAQVYGWISGNGNGNGHGYGHSHSHDYGRNGNGNGRKQGVLGVVEPFVDLVPVPVPA